MLRIALSLLIAGLTLSACSAQQKTITNVFCASLPAGQVLPEAMIHERGDGYVWMNDVKHVWVLDGTGVKVELNTGAELYFVNTACVITKVTP